MTERDIRPNCRMVYQELKNGRWVTVRKIEWMLKPFSTKRVRHFFRYWSRGKWLAAGEISISHAFRKMREHTVEEIGRMT